MEALRLGQAVDRYNYERERTRKYAANTLLNTEKVLSQFVKVNGPHLWMSRVGQPAFERFFYGDESDGITGLTDRVEPSSFNVYRGIVSRWEVWARESGHIRTPGKPYIEKIPELPVEWKDYRRLSEEEYYRALDVAGTYEPMHRAAMAVGMIVSSRASEAVSMRLGSLDRDGGEMRFTITKGSRVNKRTNTVELSPALTAELDPWLDLYAFSMGMTVPQLTQHKDWLLFPSRHYAHNFGRGGTTSYRPTQVMTAPYRIVQRSLREIGIEEKHIGFHTLRRSGARLLYEHAKAMGAKDPLRIVQVHLNHKDREVTLRYIGLQPDIEERNALLSMNNYLLAPQHRTGGNVVVLRQRH
jgi:integrase